MGRVNPRHHQYSSQAWVRNRNTPAHKEWRLPSTFVADDSYQPAIWTTQDLWLMRQQLGLSQKELATRLGHPNEKVVKNWEAGEASPKPRDSRMLLRMLTRGAQRSRTLKWILNRVRPQWRVQTGSA